MPTLIDTSLWIDFTRDRSPKSLKKFIAPYILDPEAHLAEPVAFEILRHASLIESKQLLEQFQTFPLLSTPSDLWRNAADLGQACRRKNITVGSLDLLISALALHHQAEIITFDADYQKIAAVSPLSFKLLKRPTS